MTKEFISDIEKLIEYLSNIVKYPLPEIKNKSMKLLLLQFHDFLKVNCKEFLLNFFK